MILKFGEVKIQKDEPGFKDRIIFSPKGGWAERSTPHYSISMKDGEVSWCGYHGGREKMNVQSVLSVEEAEDLVKDLQKAIAFMKSTV